MKTDIGLRIFLVILCCFFAIAFFSINIHAQDPIQVKADKECSITGDKIYLSDIASISGTDKKTIQNMGNIEIGYSPYVGMTRNIDSKEIEIRLAQYGFNPRLMDLDIPEKIYVTRKSLILSANEVEQKVRDYFEKQIVSNPDIKLKRIRGARNLKLPAGNIRTETEILRKSLSGNNYSILFSVFVNDKKSAFLQMSADVEKIVNAVVARRKIFRNQTITENDVVQVRKIADIREKNTFAFTDDVIGKKATRLIDINKPISTDMVEDIPLLERGDRVFIKVSLNGMMISALGEVLNKGFIGKSISVRNIDSGKIVNAIVLSKQEVKIAL